MSGTPLPAWREATNLIIDKHPHRSFLDPGPCMCGWRKDNPKDDAGVLNHLLFASALFLVTTGQLGEAGLPVFRALVEDFTGTLEELLIVVRGVAS